MSEQLNLMSVVQGWVLKCLEALEKRDNSTNVGGLDRTFTAKA